MEKTLPQALVTGASGFLGRHIVLALEKHGFCVITMGTGSGDGVHNHIQLQRIDDSSHIYDALYNCRSTLSCVFHLAGTTQPQYMTAVNTKWAEALLSAVVRLPCLPLVAIVGSAAEYGPQQNNPESRYGAWISETLSCTPVSDYGKSKLAQTNVALGVAQRQPIPIYRPINIIGAEMTQHLALGNFIQQAKQLPSVQSGIERCIHTGSLHAVRDFIDVQTCAQMMVQLVSITKGYGKIINICTGVGTSLNKIVKILIAQLSSPITLHSQAIQPVTEDVVVGSTDQLHSFGIDTAPCNIEQCIKSMLQQHS